MSLRPDSYLPESNRNTKAVGKSREKKNHRCTHDGKPAHQLLSKDYMPQGVGQLGEGAHSSPVRPDSWKNLGADTIPCQVSYLSLSLWFHMASEGKTNHLPICY